MTSIAGHQQWIEAPYEQRDDPPLDAIDPYLSCPNCRTPITFRTGEWNCETGCGDADWITASPRFARLVDHLVERWREEQP